VQPRPPRRVCPPCTAPRCPPSPSWSRPRPSPSPSPTPRPRSAQPSAQPTKPVKAKVIDITEADEITGDRPTGELTPIGIRQIAAGSSLLRIRQDFIDLIVKTADQI
jgi:hypothetical protein